MKRFILFLFLLIFALPAAAQEVPMGRYVESAQQLPVKLEGAYDFFTDQQGRLSFFAQSGGRLVRLFMEAGNWQSEALPWTLAQGVDLKMLADLTQSGDQVWGLTYGSSENFDAMNFTYQLITLSDGVLTEAAAPAVHESVAYPMSLKLTGEGMLLVRDYLNGGLSGFDVLNGLSLTLRLGEVSGDYALEGNTLAALSIQEGSALIYELPGDKETARKADAPLAGGATAVMGDAVALSGQDLYLANQKGIFRIALGGSVWEQLVDGSLTSLGLPNGSVTGLAQWDQDLYVLCNQGSQGLRVLKYSYDPTVPTVPAKELSVYSLATDTALVRAASLYQGAHPEYRVNLVTLLEQDAGATRQDVVSALNAELLAGKGPDLILLDGLPFDSYAEKGVLADLSDVVKKAGMLRNVAAAMTVEGAVYAAPSAMALPVLLGDAAQLERARTLEDIAGLAEKWPGGLTALPGRTAGEYFSLFAPASFDAWFDPNGELDRAALADYLVFIRRLAAACPNDEIGKATGTMASTLYSSLLPDAMAGCGGSFLEMDRVRRGASALHPMLMNGYMLDMFETTMLEQMADGAVVPLPGQAPGAFVPMTVIGVNARGAQVEAAKDFVWVLLTQSQDVADLALGFPTCSAPFEAQIAYDPEMIPMEIEAQDPANGETVTLSYGWPSLSLREKIYQMAQRLDRAYLPDQALLQLMKDALAPYFAGDMACDQATEAVGARLRAYLAE